MNQRHRTPEELALIDYLNKRDERERVDQARATHMQMVSAMDPISRATLAMFPQVTVTEATPQTDVKLRPSTEETNGHDSPIGRLMGAIYRAVDMLEGQGRRSERIAFQLLEACARYELECNPAAFGGNCMDVLRNALKGVEG